MTDKLKEIRDKQFINLPKENNQLFYVITPRRLEEIFTDIQSETYQLVNREWQNDYDILKTKYDLLIEDKLDAKQLGRQEVIEEILENDTAWSLTEVLAKLLEATEILMDEKDYDGHGWELITQAQTRGKELLTKFNQLK